MHGMNKSTLLSLGVLLLLSMSPANLKQSEAFPKAGFTAQQISVDGVPVVRLADAARGIEVSILPSLGNIASEMKIHGKNILYFPDGKLSDFQKKPMQTGIPFLAPWANRMDSDGFWANGKRYNFDAALGNYRKDGNGTAHSRIAGHFSTLARHEYRGRQTVGACDEQARILEISRHDGAMAFCPRI